MTAKLPGALVLAGLMLIFAPAIEAPLRGVRVVLRPAPRHIRVPVSGVAAAALHDSWNAPRSGGRRHQGIDIFARRGTPVVATTSGIVWRVGQNELGGNVVWILGPGGYLHYYAHLDAFGPIAGDTIVAPGDVLGTVGNSGNARGGPHHLHYSIYAPGRGAINPFTLLAASAMQRQ
jgi:murein DD-endopeptidase MepM/ murein hydrolase activator NlpD